MLFEVKKIEAPYKVCNTNNAGIVDNSQHLTSATKKLFDVVALVDHGKTIHWVSEGDWSMHQLLYEVLKKIGAADCWISSYAFSEKPARIICELKANGIIRQLKCIIDSRVDIRSASALAMMKNVCDQLKLCNTHAKVTVLKNDQWFIVIVGSSNYTTNKRCEAGFVSTQANISLFHQTWIENELRKPV